MFGPAEEAPFMRFYQATTFLFPRRYEWRILFVCFAAVLVPPLACATYQAATGQWQSEFLLVLLGATLLSTVLGLAAIRALLRPIETATQMLRAAQAGERVGPVPVGNADLVGRLLHGVTVAASESAARIERLVETTERDELTGLRSRRGFLDSARRILTDDSNGVLAMVDIDRFKAINDRFGPATGDALLREVALRLDHGVRRSDLVGRWGGEEFAILFPDTLLEEARMVMERLRASIALDPSLQGDEWPVTFSCGLAPVRSFAQLDHATRNADGALYAAKNGGRNRVQISRDD
jgi:diguanylate cyclase (GGDEF)-like protein